MIGLSLRRSSDWSEAPSSHHQFENYSKSCLLFVVNGLEYTTWWSARQYCASIGAELFVPDSKTENDNLVKYFEEWKRAGVTQMWIGVSANENCDFRKSNGYPLNYEGWSGDEPKCTSG